MGLGAMIYIPSFINNGSGIEKLTWRDTQTWKHTGSKVISLAHFYFFEIRKVG
jgi:hypothetical protein